MAQQASGQVTVATAGTEVRGPALRGTEWLIAALSTNTGVIYVGEDGAGAVSATTGFPLKPGDIIRVRAQNLNQLWFDATVNGEKVAFLRADMAE
jgi:hypothetical protein